MILMHDIGVLNARINTSLLKITLISKQWNKLLNHLLVHIILLTFVKWI